MKTKLILSIVTICYNCEKELEKTLESVERQLEHIECRKVEYVIVDGLSLDKTKDIAQNSLKKIAEMGVNTILISEKDKGIYDAINKGLSNSHGEWVLILNAGDTLFDEFVIRDVIHELEKYNPDVLYGNTIRINPFYEEVWKPDEINKLEQTMIFCHQSVFVRRELEGHYYNLKYKYCADYDLMLRLYLNKKEFRWMDRFVSNYSLDGVTAEDGIVKAYKEVQKIRLENGMIRQNLVLFKITCFVGSGKRFLLKICPDFIRWKIVGVIHGYTSNSKQ